MIIADTHTHLYAEEFDADREMLIRNAIEAGVGYFYLPNVDSGTLKPMHALQKIYTKNCFAMMGLHPCSVKENYLEELTLVENELNKGNYYGVGEIGLDFYWDKTFIREQEDAFVKQITWAVELDLPVSIHSRQATARAIELIEQNNIPVRGVFHCFSGTAEEASRVVDLGMYLGIGGVVTYKNSGLDAIVKQVGLSHIVLETDAPYLPPVPHRGKRNIPEYLIHVARKIAIIEECSLDKVAAVTTANAQRIFGKK